MKKLLTALLLITAISPLRALDPAASHTESFYPAWTRVHDPAVRASQFARAIATDTRGNVFVAGHMDVSASKQLYVAKYDALDGRRLWQRTITASGTNQVLANAIAVDAFGDCVVVGSRNVAGAIDYYTHKFSGANGADAWSGGARTYNGMAGGEDVALKVVTNGSGDVIVTGRSAGTASGSDIVTLKYARQTGDIGMVIDRYSAAAGPFNDLPGALAVDGDDNVLVGGIAAMNGSTQRFVVRKLDTNLALKWSITPIDLGGEGGVTGIAVDSASNVVATGLAKNGSGQFGYFTTKRNGSDGSEVWKTDAPSPISVATFGTPRPGPVGVAIGPDDQPIVSGTLLDASATRHIFTVKYTSAGFFGTASVVWQNVSPDYGLGFDDTVATAVFGDADSNAIVVGASENEDGNRDIYVAKYTASSGARSYFEAFAGAAGIDDSAVGAAVDPLGNIALLGDVGDNKGGSPGVAYRMFATIKLNRFIALTGDRFSVPTDANASFVTGNAPAVADDGSVAAKVTLLSYKKKLGAILAQRAGGTSSIAALQGQPAPGATTGSTVGNWVSFSDPVIAPDGTYAFAAKVTGPAAKANGLWSNASGELRLILQQGTQAQLIGTPVNIASIMSYSLQEGALIVLAKVTGPAATSNVLVRIDNNGFSSTLLRSGETGFDIGSVSHRVKSFTALSPAPASPGDGRWDGDGAVIARVIATEVANPKVTRQAIVRINSATSAISVLAHTGGAADAVASGATYKSFGLPAMSDVGIRYAASATLNPMAGTVTAANDTALIYSATGASYNAFAREGETSSDPALNGAKYSAFSDPIVATSNNLPQALFQATFKAGGGVTGANNRGLMFGSPFQPSTITCVARTGTDAPQPLADDGQPSEPVTKYGVFLAHALPDGSESAPVFVAKISGAPASSNIGVFALDSTGQPRRLLRTGDELDGMKVKAIALLKAVPKAFGAARSFNSNGSVVVQLTFTDGKTALMHLPIP